MTATLTEFTIEVLHKGQPVCLVDLKDFDAARACRRAKNAIFMQALRDGREFRPDDITTNVWEDNDYHDEEEDG